LLSLGGISVFNYDTDSLVDVIHPTKPKSGTNLLFRLAPNVRLLNNKFYFPATFNIDNHFSIPAVYDNTTKKFSFSKQKEHSHISLFPNDTISEPVYVLSDSINCIKQYNKNGDLDTYHIFKKTHRPIPYHSELLSNGKWFLSAGSHQFLIFDR